MEKAENPPDLEDRLKSLISDQTNSFYINICRGLFEKDKLLYAFLMAVNIKLDAKEVNPREWNFLLRGPMQDIPIEEEMFIPEWCSHKLYKACLSLSKESSAFKDLPSAITDPTE